MVIEQLQQENMELKKVSLERTTILIEDEPVPKAMPVLPNLREKKT